MHRFSKLKKYNRVLCNHEESKPSEYYNDFPSPFKITKMLRLKNDKKKEYQYFSQRELQNKSREIAFRPFSNINENLNNEYESKKLTPRNSKTRQISKREVIQRISQNILNERDNNRINNFLTNTLSSQEQTNIANETVVSNNGDSFSQVQNNK